MLETTLWSTGVTDKRTISTSHDGSRWRDDLKSTPLHAAIEKEVSDSRGVMDVIQQVQNVSGKKSRSDPSGEFKAANGNDIQSKNRAGIQITIRRFQAQSQLS